MYVYRVHQLKLCPKALQIWYIKLHIEHQTFTSNNYMYVFMQHQITSGFKKGPWKFSTAESKIILVLCYYAVFAIVGLSYFSIDAAQQVDRIAAIKQYFVCEAAGSGVECDRSGFSYFGHHVLSVLVYLTLGLIPAVNLTFVINWTVAKDLFQRAWKRFYLSTFNAQLSFVRAKQTST